MKRMPIVKYLTGLAMVFLMLWGTCLLAYAGEEAPDFTYSYPVDGVTFRLYEVGEVNGEEFVLTGDYAGYQVNLQEKTAPETLASYVERDGLQPVQTAVSAGGSLTFSNLEQKIYLMTGDSAVLDRVRWIPSAVLFSVPQKDEDTGELLWNITAGGKYERQPLPDLVEVSVEKIWNDKGFEKKRPVSIRAQLLKDGEVFDTVKLSKANNWKHTWTRLEPEFTWTVVEEKVPDHYKVTVRKEKGVTILENTYEKVTTPTPTPTPPPNIPYTGQLWWPVGILITIGLALILIGLIRRKRSE